MDFLHAVLYPALVVAGVLAKALHEKLTRETTAPQIEQALATALSQFKLELIRELNGTYVRSAGSEVTGSELDRRLTRLETRRA